jgi:hypothetical protein
VVVVEEEHQDEHLHLWEVEVGVDHRCLVELSRQYVHRQWLHLALEEQAQQRRQHRHRHRHHHHITLRTCQVCLDHRRSKICQKRRQSSKSRRAALLRRFLRHLQLRLAEVRRRLGLAAILAVDRRRGQAVDRRRVLAVDRRRDLAVGRRHGPVALDRLLGPVALDRRLDLVTLDRRLDLVTLDRRLDLVTLDRRLDLVTLDRRLDLVAVDRRLDLADAAAALDAVDAADVGVGVAEVDTRRPANLRLAHLREPSLRRLAVRHRHHLAVQRPHRLAAQRPHRLVVRRQRHRAAAAARHLCHPETGRLQEPRRVAEGDRLEAEAEEHHLHLLDKQRLRVGTKTHEIKEKKKLPFTFS